MIPKHTILSRAKCHLPTHPICEITIHWAAYAAKNGKQAGAGVGTSSCLVRSWSLDEV